MLRNSISYQSCRKEVFNISKNGTTIYFSKYFYEKYCSYFYCRIIFNTFSLCLYLQAPLVLRPPL